MSKGIVTGIDIGSSKITTLIVNIEDDTSGGDLGLIVA